MLAAAVRHYLSMTTTKKFNRVGGNILVVLIFVLNLATVANLYAEGPYPPAKSLYDHSRIKNLDADDAQYIMRLVDKNNTKGYFKSVTWMFFDNLRVIDKETAASITDGTISGVVLGVTSIDDDALTQLLSTLGDKEIKDKDFIDLSLPIPPQDKEEPCLRFLVFNRLKTLSDAQVRMLMEWRGSTLVVPSTLEMSTEAHTDINDNYRRWEFETLSESEMEACRQQLIKDHFH